MNLNVRLRGQLDHFGLDVELALPAQGITALYGASGAGKTTLLRAIAGLDRHPGARLVFSGQVWQDENNFVPTHRRQLGYVFQEASLFPHLNVQGNIEYGLKRGQRQAAAIAFDQAVEVLGLQSLLQRMPDTLSGGERQRVAIARALAASPGLMLMDEPLAGLDRQRKQEVLPYIESLHQNLQTPIIYVSHSATEVARLADHLVLLEAGRVSASGPVAEILTRLDLPLAHDHQAAALIEATVAGHDEHYQLTYLDFAGGQFSVEQRPLPNGSTVRVRLAARDVSLTIERPAKTSILNVFAAEVDEIQSESASQVLVRLNCGGTMVLARITRKSCDALGLQPGFAVFVQAKTIALLG